MSGIAPLCFKKSAGISGADRRSGGREVPRRRLRPGGGPPGPLRRRPGQETGRPVVVVCADEGEAGRMARDLSYLTGGAVPVLASRSFVFHSIATVSASGSTGGWPCCGSSTGGSSPVWWPRWRPSSSAPCRPRCWTSVCAVLEPGQQADLNQLTEALTAAGYVRCDQVEGAGQFALRGGILDVYSPGMAAPVRAEFWGDELDTMGTFDPSTQRRTENVDRAVLLPAAETLPQLSQGGLSRSAGAAGSALRQGPEGRETRTWPSPSSRTGTPWGRAAPSPPPTGTLPPHLPQAGHGGGLPAPGRLRPPVREQPGGGAGQDLSVAAGGGRKDPAGAGGAGRLLRGAVPPLRPAVPEGWRIFPSPTWTPSPCPPTRCTQVPPVRHGQAAALLRGPAWRRRCRTSPTTRARAFPCWCWCPASSAA